MPQPTSRPASRDQRPETRDQAPETRRARRLCWGVFLLTLAIYLLSANGHLVGQDQEYFYRMARALALDHSFAVEPLVAGGRELAGTRGSDGRFYAQYAPGLPLALAPLALIGRALAGPAADLRPHYAWGAQDLADLGGRFLVSYFNTPVTAASAALLALLVVRLGYPARAAAFVALVFAVATPAWGQARVVFAEPLQGLLLLLACLLLIRAARQATLLAGLALALALLVKLTSAIALPALLLLPDTHGRPLWRTPARVALLVMPVVGVLAGQALYNLARFGSPLATGYTTGGGGGLDFGGNPFVGLYGLLLSPGRGLVWFAPPVLAALLALRHFYTRRPTVTAAFVALPGLWLLVHAFWRDWDSGWGWGPRYLMPILPFVLLSLAEWWEHPHARLATLGLTALGALVQLPGATVDFMASGGQGLRTFSERCGNCNLADFAAWRNFDPAGSELKVHTEMLLAGKLDLAWIIFGGTWVVPLTFLLVAALALAAVALLREPLGWSIPAPLLSARPEGGSERSRRPIQSSRRARRTTGRS